MKSLQALAISCAMKRAAHKSEGGAIYCDHGGPLHCMKGCYDRGGEVIAEHEIDEDGMHHGEDLSLKELYAEDMGNEDPAHIPEKHRMLAKMLLQRHLSKMS